MPLLSQPYPEISEAPGSRPEDHPQSPRNRGEDWLRRCLAARATGFVATALALSLIILACGITLRLGVPHAAMYGQDTFIVLDGGWRALNGQRPHADFYSAFGPLQYLIAAAGLKLAGLRVEGLAYATAGVGAVLGIWAWVLVRRRLKAWPALLALAFLVMFALAPFPYGEPFYMTGYAMQYNRIGYVLASLILLELYTPGAGFPRKRNLDWGGFSTGIAAGLLCSVKITYFLVACALIASAYILGRKRRTHFLSVLAGFGLIAIPALAYIHWDLAAMLRDLTLVAAARQVRFAQSFDPFRTPLRNLGTILPLLGLAYLAWLLSKGSKTGRNRERLLGTFGFATVVLAADLVLAMANTQRQGFPLSLLAALILVARICNASRATLHKSPQLATAVPGVFALVAAILLMPAITDTVNAWGMVFRSNVLKLSSADSSTARFDAPLLAGLVLEDHNEPRIDPAAHNGALYVTRVNEGLALLRHATSPGESIACLWFADPFSYALERPPAEGGSAFYSYGVNVSAGHTPSAARILGNADVVMYPKPNRDDTENETLLAVVGPVLARDYTLAAESPQWVLWRRKR